MENTLKKCRLQNAVSRVKFFLVIVLSVVVVLCLFPATTIPHPGRLDKKGGHYDQKTGFYHLHRAGDDTTEYNVEFDQQIQGAKAVKVLDGDTIEIEHGPLKERVRLDKQVTLKLDAQVRAKYGRLLAYVSLEDGQDTFVNAKLIQNGYAVLMTMPPNVKHA